MSKKYSWCFLSVLCLVVIGLTAGNVFAVKQSPEKKNMQLLGYNDVQGRETLQVTTQEAYGKSWAFIGHHNRPSFVDIHYNPLTDENEENGTTILDTTDPRNPVVVVHIPNFNFAGTAQQNRNSRSTSVVTNFKGSGKDFLIRNSEGDGTWYYEIFDITNILQEGGVNYIKIGNLQSTLPNSCRPGCGGILTSAHKGYFSPSGMYYSSSNEPGFRDQHLIAWDLSDLHTIAPGAWNQELGATRFAGRGWLPGQKDLEPAPADDISSHHPIVDEVNDRVYMAFLSGGNVAAFDISGVGPGYQYPVAWQIDTEPPGRGTHTVAPVFYSQVENFGEGALPRVYALVADEGVGGDIECVNPVRTKNYMLDITDADLFLGGTGVAFSVETWQVPDGDFCEKGGRFGPHQFAETVSSQLNQFTDKIAFFAYFNAGVRVVDISNPYELKEVGYYVPQAYPTTRGINSASDAAGKFVIQINDVDVDSRGLVNATDRVGSGFFILEFKK